VAKEIIKIKKISLQTRRHEKQAHNEISSHHPRATACDQPFIQQMASKQFKTESCEYKT
jgi:hypothetical protein